MFKQIFMYSMMIFITVIIFGFQSGLIEIKNPNRVLYEKSRYWTIEE